MTTSPNDTGAELAALGRELRLERQRQGLSVNALSERSGVSFGLISQLERGLGNPSFLSLKRVTDALGTSLGALLGKTERTLDPVVRANERRRLPFLEEEPASQRVVRELLTPGMRGTLQVIRSSLPVGFTNEGKAFRHMGTECVIVESGTLTVVHGEREVELTQGDAMTYVCSIPHWWANRGTEPCVVLGVVTPFE